MPLRSQETGLSLGSAPEFGSDGSWPPIHTEWVPLRWQIFEGKQASREAAAAHARLGPVAIRRFNPSALDDVMSKTVSWGSGVDHPFVLVTANSMGKRGSGFYLRFTEWESVNQGRAEYLLSSSRGTFVPNSKKELRRLVHAVRWQRKDPPTQLPPGVTNKVMHSVLTGLSVENTQRLATSLEIKVGAGKIASQTALNSKMQQEFELKIGVTVQEQSSTELTLTSPRGDKYTVYALWNIVQRIQIDALSAPIRNEQVRMAAAYWEPRDRIDFSINGDPYITSFPPPG